MGYDSSKSPIHGQNIDVVSDWSRCNIVQHEGAATCYDDAEFARWLTECEGCLLVDRKKRISDIANIIALLSYY